MPLPSALAAKLAKRGLLASKKTAEPSKKANYKGWSTCPNKNNIFHECSVWCETHWKGVITPDPRYMRNMQKLLYKFPLPNNWTEVFDKGLGRYYYWNMENDLVSWLPPRHPKSIKTISAAKLRERRILGELESKNEKERERDRDSDNDSRDSDEEERSHYKHSRRDKEREDRKYRDKRDERHSRKKRREDNNLDPMDPAAYSDIPQGTWSDGLDNNKGRADSSAPGALYQQRPYPAPGEVLASNKEKSKNKK